MPVAIEEVASQAGVSHTTGSRAPGGSSLISDETTGQIQETALALGIIVAIKMVKKNNSTSNDCALNVLSLRIEREPAVPGWLPCSVGFASRSVAASQQDNSFIGAGGTQQ